MNIARMLTTFLCALFIFIPVVIIGIYGTKARIRYVTFTNELRRNGKYLEWESANRIVLFAENFCIYAFIASFFAFIITGILRFEGIARFFFICFIVFCLAGIISSFILYRKVPRE